MPPPPSPQVRWAACQALGQMCTDLGPELQNTYHAKVLPAIMALMDDFTNPRVQVRALGECGGAARQGAAGHHGAHGRLHKP